ncbi:RNA-directed DNA polymerase from mobile element jockey [Elysia marginata]|uniref:RNA-directed DNA polymerase from mobile element jockey n=1 Tax=Elysia marginata TaxID=1093978 RepID=A0AAV4EC38_9GAST|nr:RNA-directed DNA polymerase from mobile element jockey [Elysia marginata]
MTSEERRKFYKRPGKDAVEIRVALKDTLRLGQRSERERLITRKRLKVESLDEADCKLSSEEQQSQTIILKRVYGAMYANDMAIWATQEYTGTAQAHLQLALDALRMWTGKWLMKINPEKTTFTTFTLSTKFQAIRLKIGEHQLQEEPSSTYLGVTCDKRLSWKAQTDKCQERGLLRTRNIQSRNGQESTPMVLPLMLWDMEVVEFMLLYQMELH